MWFLSDFFDFLGEVMVPFISFALLLIIATSLLIGTLFLSELLTVDTRFKAFNQVSGCNLSPSVWISLDNINPETCKPYNKQRKTQDLNVDLK